MVRERLIDMADRIAEVCRRPESPPAGEVKAAAEPPRTLVKHRADRMRRLARKGA